MQKKKISALFALFTIMIVYFKRSQNIPSIETLDGVIEGFVATRLDARSAFHLLDARYFARSWSFDLALGGVVSG